MDRYDPFHLKAPTPSPYFIMMLQAKARAGKVLLGKEVLFTAPETLMLEDLRTIGLWAVLPDAKNAPGHLRPGE